MGAHEDVHSEGAGSRGDVGREVLGQQHHPEGT